MVDSDGERGLCGIADRSGVGNRGKETWAWRGAGGSAEVKKRGILMLADEGSVEVRR